MVSESNMQECVPLDVSQQSRGQMSQLIRSQASPIHTLVLLSVLWRWLTYTALGQRLLIQINLKTYLFSVLWASIHTKLLFPIARFSKSPQSG